MLDNTQSLEDFLAAVEKKAYRMAFIATGCRDDALDVVQDSMCTLVQRYASKPADAWRPLFYKVLQNKIRDWYRRQSVRGRWHVWLENLRGGNDREDFEDPIDTLPDLSNNNPEDRKIMSDSVQALESSLRTLSLRQQQVFLLRAWEGLNVMETAEAMGCSAGSVKTHYARALQTLRDLLEGHRP